MLFSPLVFLYSEYEPIATLLLAVVLADNAFEP